MENDCSEREGGSRGKLFQKFSAVVSHHGLGFDVIEFLLNRPDRQARVGEVAIALATSKTRASRTMATLCEAELIYQMSPTGTYQLIDEDLPHF